MAIQHTAQDHSPAARAALVEAYRRVVEIDAAVTEATTVDLELHSWCEARLGDLLRLLEPYVDGAALEAEAPTDE